MENNKSKKCLNLTDETKKQLKENGWLKISMGQTTMKLCGFQLLKK